MLEEDFLRGIIDYKFYCFYVEPEYLCILAGLENHITAHISFYNLDLPEAVFQRNGFKYFDKIPKVPQRYYEMIEAAKELLKSIPWKEYREQCVEFVFFIQKEMKL